jgi:anaerobic selenocysteine-containing dehydrogenase
MKERIPTFCANCVVHCAGYAIVEDGKMVDWDQDKDSDFPCRPCRSFKAKANPEIAYHPERLKYPLRRVGEKGGGKWERISWDEAFGEITGKLAELKGKYGAGCLGAAVGEPKALEFVWLQRFCTAFGTGNITTPHPL